VQLFEPNRSQRRAIKQHGALQTTFLDLRFHPEHYALYRKYQSTRHAYGGMDQDSREQYSHFLLQSRVNTRLVEFREDGVLRMVSIVDELQDGLSSVYTFYDTAQARVSYGTYNVLWQIAEAQRRRLSYLYLGYWINESRKMAYKALFRPIEGLIGGQWQRLP
jgi:leucyl-tRNA---protein transferase